MASFPGSTDTVVDVRTRSRSKDRPQRAVDKHGACRLIAGGSLGDRLILTGRLNARRAWAQSFQISSYTPRAISAARSLICFRPQVAAASTDGSIHACPAF